MLLVYASVGVVMPVTNNFIWHHVNARVSVHIHSYAYAVCAIRFHFLVRRPCPTLISSHAHKIPRSRFQTKELKLVFKTSRDHLLIEYSSRLSIDISGSLNRKRAVSRCQRWSLRPTGLVVSGAASWEHWREPDSRCGERPEGPKRETASFSTKCVCCYNVQLQS